MPASRAAQESRQLISPETLVFASSKEEYIVLLLRWKASMVEMKEMLVGNMRLAVSASCKKLKKNILTTTNPSIVSKCKKIIMAI